MLFKDVDVVSFASGLSMAAPGADLVGPRGSVREGLPLVAARWEDGVLSYAEYRRPGGSLEVTRLHGDLAAAILRIDGWKITLTGEMDPEGGELYSIEEMEPI